MRTIKIVGLAVLALLWIWLSLAVLNGGITLYSIFIVAASGIIIFVPLWRKYGPEIRKNNKDDKK